MTEKNVDAFSFEEAYARLETILEELNSGELFLEKSLKLYEEANRLIAHCNQKLSFAEQKIQMLTKNREGRVEIDEVSEAKLKEFSHQLHDGIPRAPLPSS